MHLLTLLLAFTGLTLALPQSPHPGVNSTKDCIAWHYPGFTPGPRGWGRPDSLCYHTPFKSNVDIKDDCYCYFFNK
jgi:hypothetical protein